MNEIGSERALWTRYEPPNTAAVISATFTRAIIVRASRFDLQRFHFIVVHPGNWWFSGRVETSEVPIRQVAELASSSTGAGTITLHLLGYYVATVGDDRVY